MTKCETFLVTEGWAGLYRSKWQNNNWTMFQSPTASDYKRFHRNLRVVFSLFVTNFIKFISSWQGIGISSHLSLAIQVKDRIKRWFLWRTILVSLNKVQCVHNRNWIKYTTANTKSENPSSIDSWWLLITISIADHPSLPSAVILELISTSSKTWGKVAVAWGEGKTTVVQATVFR